MRRITVSVVVGITLIVCSGAAQAASFTPLPWQKVVRQSICGPSACPPAVDPIFVGQRKHVGWTRDRLDFSAGGPGQPQRRPNFIDDAAEEVCFGARPASHSPVDVIVQLNECLTPAEIRDVLSPYGVVAYSGKVVSFVLLNGVDCDDLPDLAADPHVAMVELQLRVEPMNDVGSRAVQSRASSTYSPSTAQDDALSGAGVNVAVLDTGVDDAIHGSFTGKFVAGFDATIFEDDGLAGGTAGNGVDDSCEDGSGCDDADDEPGDGTTNPDDTDGHGTHVAGIAIGAGTTGATCRTPDDGSSPTSCAGVAGGASLVDVKVLGSGLTVTQQLQDVAEGLDWLILNASSLPGGVQVANMSLGVCPSFGAPGYGDDDGTAALALQANALAAAGILPVVAHGNASNCSVAAGTVLTVAPGSASLALTVGGTNDQGTVSRADDANYTQFLQGPRVDFLPAMTNLLALKPDIVAPGDETASSSSTGDGICSADNDTVTASETACFTGGAGQNYVYKSGTSMAAPQVAGGAAVVLEAKPGITPGSLKALLKNTADSSLNTAAFPAVDAVWDDDFGSGMLDVWAAEQQTTESDVGFPSCTGAPGGTSEVADACDLCCSLPDYGNSIDITTATPPEEGVPNTLMAEVENAGPAAATVLVNFSVYPFAAGNKQFYDIGTQKVTIAAGDTVTVSQPWTPDDSGHNCLQVTIDYDMDTDYDNNVTQRNVEVAASTYQMRVENPFPVPARFEIRTSSNRAGWRCEVSDATFSLHPFLDCPRNVTVRFDPSRRARLGDRGRCDVDVFATPEGGGARLVGGVTVETFVCDRAPGADCDGDGVPNADDNCLGRWNTLQEDRDSDGVGDACDLCAQTSPGASPVSHQGCTVDQTCPCDGAGNHGQYVRCVAHEVDEMRSDGVISGRERGRIVSQAARSSCGK